MRRAIDRRFDGPKHLRTRHFSDDDDDDEFDDEYGSEDYSDDEYNCQFGGYRGYGAGGFGGRRRERDDCCVM